MERFRINWRKFGLHHEDWSDFCISQWFSPNYDSKNLIYIAYRSAFVFYLVILMVLDMDRNYIQEDAGGYFFIYVTNWAYICLVGTSVFQAINAITFAAASSTFAPKLLWIMLNISHTSVLFVCIFFWIFVYDNGTIQFSFLNTHAIVGVYAVIDVLVIKSPRRLHHFYMPLTFGLVYTVFTVVYFFLGGTRKDGSEAIYNVLDWNKPMSASVMILISCATVGILHVGTCVTHLFSRCLFYREKANEAKVEEQIGKVEI